MLKEDLKDCLRFYTHSYPDITVEKAYLLGRLLLRFAVYQKMHDKESLTGSDHGPMHGHHNIGHSSFMHSHLDAKHQNPKLMFLLHVTHMLHDIGYSGAIKDVKDNKTSNEFFKDHPFYGGAVIEELKPYLNELIGIKETEMVQKCIVNHAIASFESDPNDMESMLNFLMTQADACAASSDQKAQSLWRDHPATIIPLLRLSSMVNVLPEVAKYFNDRRINTDPKSVFKDLGALSAKGELAAWPEKLEDLPADYFKDQNVHFAYIIYEQCKNDLLALIDQIEVGEDKELYKGAVYDFLNLIGGNIVLGQFGVGVHEVSVSKPKELTDEKHQYVPKITLGKGVLYGLIEKLAQNEARKNIKKILKEEYGASGDQIDRLLNENREDQCYIVASPVAKLYLDTTPGVIKGVLAESSEIMAKEKEVSIIYREASEMKELMNNMYESIQKWNKLLIDNKPDEARVVKDQYMKLRQDFLGLADRSILQEERDHYIEVFEDTQKKLKKGIILSPEELQKVNKQFNLIAINSTSLWSFVAKGHLYDKNYFNKPAIPHTEHLATNLNKGAANV